MKILKGVSLKAPKNKIVAIVGHSGSGKSSIISLIQRFYDPVEGKILYSGEDIKEVENTWYHQSQIAYVQ